jgi:hypothetical protein
MNEKERSGLDAAREALGATSALILPAKVRLALQLLLGDLQLMRAQLAESRGEIESLRARMDQRDREREESTVATGELMRGMLAVLESPGDEGVGELKAMVWKANDLMTEALKGVK